jgi:hypothetical protein
VEEGRGMTEQRCVTKEEFDYFLSKLNLAHSNLDGKAIDIMNRLDTLFEKDKLQATIEGLYTREEVEKIVTEPFKHCSSAEDNGCTDWSCDRDPECFLLRKKGE